MVQNRITQLSKWIVELIFVFCTLLYIVPLWMVIANSFKSQKEANFFKLSFPTRLEWSNYIHVFQEANILRGLWNGMLLGGAVVIASMIFSSMAAFYIARSTSRASSNLFAFFVAGLIIPIAIVPTYYIFSFLHLNNTYSGLIIIFITYTLPFSIFMYNGFIKVIPRELDEAATIDGCGPYKLFFTTIFPLLAPATFTVAMFNFLFVWNEVGTYLFFANSDKWPISIGIYNFFGKLVSTWNLAFADIIIGIIPSLVVFIFGQRYVVSGLTAGAVKG